MMEEFSIKVSNLGKRYTIGVSKEGSLRDTLGNIFRSEAKKGEEFWALRNIDFTINQGDVVGIVGKNGAGKSTLLKLLSQITKPTEGRIQLNGRVASLLEVGTGFHPELTGRENVYLNGTILGMSRKEVKDKFDEIVAFSGVEKFIDTPVKRYSSGMYVRLAFAVAAHLEPEILIIDEVLAVGDAEFQKKCLGKMRDVATEGRTVLFVSHNMAAVKELCTKGILLEKGEIKVQGDITTVLSEYSRTGDENAIVSKENAPSKALCFKSISVENTSANICSDFTWQDEIILRFNFHINEKDHKYGLFAMIKDKYGAPVFAAECQISRDEIILRIHKEFLTRGNYSLTTFIHIPKLEQLDAFHDICEFTVSDATSRLAVHGNYEYGNVFGQFNWE